VSRAGVFERDAAMHELRTGEDVQASDAEVSGGIGLVPDRPLHIDEDAPDRVDDPDERIEVHEGVAVQPDAQDLLHRPPGELRSAIGIRGVDLPLSVAGDGRERVAGDRQHRGGSVQRVE